MRRLATHLGWLARTGRRIGWLVLLMTCAGTASGQGRYPYGDFGYGVAPSPWTPSWYFRPEYTGMWAKGTRLPALLTTSPAGTAPENAGVLGEPGTEILVGGERTVDKGRQGVRMTLGHWLDIEQVFAVEAQYWMLGGGDSGQGQSSTGETILARPFFNIKTGDQDAQVLAFPGVLAGALSAQYGSEAHSAGILARYNWLEAPDGYVNLLAGYRYFRFRETLAINASLLDQLSVSDRFVTENDFSGIDLGATFGWGRKDCLLDVTAKIALGGMHEKLTVRGRSQFDGAAQPGGWLTAPSNLGSHTRNVFAAIPELGVKFSYVGIDSLRLSVGYDLLLITNAIRVGESIDTTLNPDQLAPLPLARGGGDPSNALRPAPLLNDSSLWLQGVTFGAEIRW